MKFKIRTAKKEWICFDCGEEINKSESYYDTSTPDFNSTKEGRKSALKLCKDCGNRWAEKYDGVILNSSQKIGRLQVKNE